MAPPLSQETRERIVYWSSVLHKPASEISILAECSERTVYDILRLHRDYGVVHNPFARPRGRPRTLDTGDMNYISSILSANPSLYLDEIQLSLINVRQVDVSLATISRAIRHMALTHKQVSKSAMERNELLRATWQAEYGDIPAHFFIWLDESSVDDITNQRQDGWSSLGRACVRRATFIRGRRYSVLPALTYEGVAALDIFEGSVTKERFIQFLEVELAPQLSPYPGARSVVVLDNCAIHHDEEVRRIVETECGAKLIYLPPYSPDFNPIEQAFHSVKSWLRRHEADATRPEVRPWLIEQAAASVSREDAEGWIVNCSYSFV